MLDVKAVAFTTIAGLRGMLPLLLLRVVIDAPLRKSPSGEINHDALLLQAQTVIWAACFIVLTLVGASNACVFNRSNCRRC